jgi:hypothetical protein
MLGIYLHTHPFTCTNTHLLAHTPIYLHTHPFTCTDTHLLAQTPIYLHTHPFTCTHTHLLAHTPIYLHRHPFTCTDTHLFAHTHPFTCTHTHLFAHTPIYLHTHPFTCTHTHLLAHTPIYLHKHPDRLDTCTCNPMQPTLRHRPPATEDSETDCWLRWSYHMQLSAAMLAGGHVPLLHIPGQRVVLATWCRIKHNTHAHTHMQTALTPPHEPSTAPLQRHPL